MNNMSDMGVNDKIIESNYSDYEKEVNEDIYLLYDYLPVLYKDENERKYVQTLFKALTLSYSNGLYQFAYIQLHMIFMVCIYYLLLQLLRIFQSDGQHLYL